jgi:hypothetical protein
VSYRPNDPRAKLAGELLRDMGKHDLPERRAGPRFHAPTLVVMIDRRIYQTVDWGLGAMVVGGYKPTVKLGAVVGVVLSSPGAPEITHKATARILRIDHRRELVTLQFVEIGKGLLGWLGDLRLGGTD